MEPILLYDTTLRDGTQGENINFTAEEKIKIAERFDGKDDVNPIALCHQCCSLCATFRKSDQNPIPSACAKQ